VRTDGGPTGKRNDFEAAATQFLPYDPVAKKRLSGTKREAGMISSVMDIAEDDQTQAGNQQLARLVSTYDTTSNKNTRNFQGSRKMSYACGEKIVKKSNRLPNPMAKARRCLTTRNNWPHL
jgi:hypothetical protein